MNKILSYGSLNVDMVYSMPHFVQPGETIAAYKMERFPGGKGLNQSVALSRAGAKVWHGGKIGADGKWLSDILEESGADVSFLRNSGSSTGTAIIQVAPSGENCIILNHGANYENTKEEIDEALKNFGAGDILLLQNEINLLPYLVEKAAEKGMDIALNPSPIDENLMKMDLSPVRYLILNEIEGEAITGANVPEEICGALLKKYPEMKIVLTMGGEGALYMDKDSTYRQSIFEVKAVDTTGAGDTFTGYFLAFISAGESVREALKAASKAAAIAVSRNGAAASIPLREEVMAAQLREKN